MHNKLFLILTFATFPLFALDLTSLVGKSFFIIQYQKVVENNGKLLIGETAQDYFFNLSNIAKNPQPAIREKKYSFPKASTQVETQDQELTLTFSENGNFQKIVIEDKGLFLNFKVTEKNAAEETFDFIVSIGGAEGTEVLPETFFRQLSGSYKISLAGGKTPHDSSNELVIDTTDSKEAALYAPFCSDTSGMCDAGYHGFIYAKTRVFQTQTSSGQDFFYVFETLNGEFRYTSFEKRFDSWVLRNYQYSLDGKETLLEHQFSPAP